MSSHLTDAERETLSPFIWGAWVGVAKGREADYSRELHATIEEIIDARLTPLADLITRHEAHDGRVPCCQLRAVLGMPARDRGER